MSTGNPNDDLFQSFREGIEGIGKKVTSFVDEVFNAEGAGGEVKLKTDIYQTNESLVVELELPGVKKEQVKIQVQDGILHIRGRKEAPEGLTTHLYERQERRFGPFGKSLMLPDTVELEGIKAKFEDGVLAVRFPLKEASTPETDNDVNIE